jgi:ATP-binding cassette subfamily B protein
MILLVILALFGQAMCELTLPKYMADIINDGIIQGDMPYIFKVGGIMVLIAVVTTLFAAIGDYFAAKTAAKTSRDIRRALFKNVTAFSATELEQFSTTSLITRSTNDVQTVQQTTVMMLRIAIFAPLMGIGSVVRALNTSIDLAWTIVLSLVCVLTLMLLMFFLVMPKFKILQKMLDRLNLVISERLSGLLVVRAFTAEEHEEERFDNAVVVRISRLRK